MNHNTYQLFKELLMSPWMLIFIVLFGMVLYTGIKAMVGQRRELRRARQSRAYWRQQFENELPDIRDRNRRLIAERDTDVLLLSHDIQSNTADPIRQFVKETLGEDIATNDGINDHDDDEDQFVRTNEIIQQSQDQNSNDVFVPIDSEQTDKDSAQPARKLDPLSAFEDPAPNLNVAENGGQR